MMREIGNSFFWILSKSMILFQYPLSWMLYCIMNYVINYRKEVIENNLKKSFPNKSSKEIKQIRNKFYQNFSDFIIENIKLIAMTEKQLRAAMEINQEQIEDIEKRRLKNKNIVLLSGHVLNWEYYSILAAKFSGYNLLYGYRIIRNPFFENLMKRTRSKFGGILIDYRKVYMNFIRLQKTSEKPAMVFIGGDQLPPKGNKLVEETFLNQKTYFFDGINVISKRMNAVVLFIYPKKIKRFKYKFCYQVITEEPNEVGERFITKRYSQLLEEIIAESPDNWLWSHKRWKKV